MGKLSALAGTLCRGCVSALWGSVAIALILSVFVYTSFLAIDSLQLVGISTKPGGLHVTRP
jgi:hypothetical protein